MAAGGIAKKCRAAKSIKSKSLKSLKSLNQIGFAEINKFILRRKALRAFHR